MIVKNEERNIRQALSWGKGLVSEQIVVDTGSTDGTVRIAKEMGAEVYTFTWVNDFAKAKNYAISKASGDWILFLDADEYIAEQDVKKIPSILLKAHEEQFSVIQSSWVQLGLNKTVTGTFIQWRIFRNSPYIRYHGAIHEQLCDTRGKSLRIARAEKEIPIFHTGYNWSQVDRVEKGSRNIELIEKELKKNPMSSVMNFYMAESLYASGKIEESMAYADIALENKDNLLPDDVKASLYQTKLYGLYSLAENGADYEEKMYDLYLKAVSFQPSFPDYDVSMAFFYYDRQEWEKAIFYFTQALKKASQIKENSYSHIAVYLKQIYYGLSAAYGYLGRYSDSVAYVVPYLKEFDKYDKNALIILLKALYTDKNTMPEASLGFLQRLYNLRQDKDVLHVLKAVKLTGWTEMEEAVKNLLPEEKRKQIYPEKKNLQLYYTSNMTSLDHDYFTFAELIQNTSKEFLLSHMEEILKELKISNIESYFYLSKKICSNILWNEQKVSQLLSSNIKMYAEDLWDYLLDYVFLYRELKDETSQKTLYYLMKGWLTLQQELIDLAADNTNLTIDDEVAKVTANIINIIEVENNFKKLKEQSQYIVNNKPMIAVCVSLLNGDLRQISAYIKEMQSDYQLYLRYYENGELILYGK